VKSILFCMRYFTGKSKNNLSSKFKNQILAAKNLGYDVWFIEISEDEVYLSNNKDRIKLTMIQKTNIPVVSNILFYKKFYKAIYKVSKYKVRFDYIYIRSMFYLPSLSRAIKKLKQNNSKIIMEIPTYPANGEIRTLRFGMRKVILKISLMLEKDLAKYVDLYTLIGEKADKYFDRPAINIENGVSVIETQLRKPKLNNAEIHLLAIATVARWHGFDRMIDGLYNYYISGGKEKVFLHIVGPDGDGTLTQLKELTLKYKLENIVLFEGPKYGEELNDIINKCDIGVASLGLYRIDIKNALVLKVREYMVRGLPFIYACEDNAIDVSSKYVLKVPNNDSYIDINSIVKFANSLREYSKLPEEMRSYAENNMTWEKQFEKIFNYVDYRLDDY